MARWLVFEGHALKIDYSGRQVSLYFHVGEAAPDGAREPVPGLRLTVEAF
jgi:hypothetical protein